jgi:hypothetical protein
MQFPYYPELTNLKLTVRTSIPGSKKTIPRVLSRSGELSLVLRTGAATQSIARHRVLSMRRCLHEDAAYQGGVHRWSVL